MAGFLDVRETLIRALGVRPIAGADGGSQPILWKMIVLEAVQSAETAEYPASCITAPDRIARKRNGADGRHIFHLINIKNVIDSPQGQKYAALTMYA